MKKTCNGCRAYTKGDRSGRCSLGYSIKDIYIPKSGSFIETKPLEECPKPKTNNEYINLFLNR